MKIRIIIILSIALFIFNLSAFDDESSRRLNRAEKAVEGNDIPMAISIYSQFLREYSPQAPKEDQLRYADIFLKGQDLCWQQNRFLEALEFAAAGMKAAHNGADPSREVRFLGSIGNLHGVFEDHERSSYYYLKGYRLALDNDLRSQQWKFLVSLVQSSIATGNLAQAKDFFTKLNLVEAPDSTLSVFFNNYLQGIIASADAQPELAMRFHRNALSAALRNNLREYSSNEYWEIGRAFFQMERNDSAKHYFKLALDETTRTGQPGELPKIYLSLGKSAQADGDTAAYERYNTLHKEAYDAIFNIKTFNSKRNQLVEYEELMRDTTIDGLNKRIWIQTTLLISTGVILFVVLIFYILLKRRNNALRYANNKLLDRNRELIKAEELNKKLMDEKLESAAAEDENNPDKTTGSDNDGSVEGETVDTAGSSRAPYLGDEQKEILLSRIRKILNQTDHPFNPEFSLNTLAQLVKSNTKYVSWVINETYGKNFKTILNELRVREASKMLDDHETYGAYTIQTISEEVGYKSSTSFIQAFKKLVGMTPSVYQKLSIQRSEGTESESGQDS